MTGILGKPHISLAVSFIVCEMAGRVKDQPYRATVMLTELLWSAWSTVLCNPWQVSWLALLMQSIAFLDSVLKEG